MDVSKEKNFRNDESIVREIWKLLNEADIILGQNSKKFDIKKLNAKFLEYGFHPPRSFKHIDTFEIAKRNFAFTSNKLEYATKKFNKKYKKLDHPEFGGFSLWSECMLGNLKAWAEMKKYNIHDVLALEEYYKQIRPYDKSLNVNLYHEDLEHVCACGSTSFTKSGFHYTSAGKYQKWQCTECGAEHRDSENLFSKEKRKSLKRPLK
jgi:hypothetical protein